MSLIQGAFHDHKETLEAGEAKHSGWAHLRSEQRVEWSGLQLKERS